MDRHKVIADFEDRCHFALGMLAHDQYRPYIEQFYLEVLQASSCKKLSDRDFAAFYKRLIEMDFLSCFNVVVYPRDEKVKRFKEMLLNGFAWK